MTSAGTLASGGLPTNEASGSPATKADTDTCLYSFYYDLKGLTSSILIFNIQISAYLP